MSNKTTLSAKLQPYWLVGVASILAVGLILFSTRPSNSAPDKSRPTYPKTTPKGMATATVAGGCFWSMEAIYKRLKGVQSAEPGFTGGTTKNPSYEEVCTETTGHAESVNITYDPKVISYADLLQVMLTVTDPTTLNRQGGDEGTSYRSAIFYRTPQEKQIAEETIKKVSASGIWKDSIVTQVVPLKKFFPAESYHDNYYDTHTGEGYCRAVILPKLDKLNDHFASKLK